MEILNSQPGEPFVDAVAGFIRKHEKALANSLQFIAQRRQSVSRPTNPTSPTTSTTTTTHGSQTSTIAAALSFAGLSFRSHTIKQAHLTLTPHHLFYLLSKIEELDINVGPMNVRTESIHTDLSASNYVSFLQSKKPERRGDADSIHSVSSVRSVMSNMSSLWSSLGLGSGAVRSEKAQLALEADLKYLYGAFTKLPSLRLAPDHRTPLIKGFEQFPFDTAVPLFAFKNCQFLEITDLDFRQFHGWDRLAEQLTWLIVKRAHVDDPVDLLTNIVLDDADRRRKRSTRGYMDAMSTPSWSVPSTPRAEYARSTSDSGSPPKITPSSSPVVRSSREIDEDGMTTPNRSKSISTHVPGSVSPKRPTTGRPTSSYRHVRTYSTKVRRSGSGGSLSSEVHNHPQKSEASLLQTDSNVLPASKWQRLVFLSLRDNGLASLTQRSVAPITGTLRSFDLSSNMFTEVPESLASFSRLASLDLSNCLIDSLTSLATHPLPAITTLKLKGNKLQSLKGIERLPSLENLHIADNLLTDPSEAARLTAIPSLRRIWIKRNPFTRKFPDYRIRIFNMFRKTPGFHEDIIIDDAPPSYLEKKQLIERVPENEPAQNKVQEIEQRVAVVVQRPVPTSTKSEPKEPPTALQREASLSSTKKKRTTRRRVVDLMQEEESPPMRPRVTEERQVSFEDRPNISVRTDDSRTSTIQESALATRPTLLPPVDSLDNERFQLQVDDIRQRVGNAWLGASAEQAFANSPHLAQPAHLLHHHSTPSIVSGGRSLG